MSISHVKEFVKKCQGRKCLLDNNTLKCTVVECSIAFCDRKKELYHWKEFVPKSTVRETEKQLVSKLDITQPEKIKVNSKDTLQSDPDNVSTDPTVVVIPCKTIDKISNIVSEKKSDKHLFKDLDITDPLITDSDDQV